jgi:hypothetical protein
MSGGMIQFSGLDQNLWVRIWVGFKKNVANLWSGSTCSSEKPGLSDLFVYRCHIYKAYRLTIFLQVFKDWYHCIITPPRPWGKHILLKYNIDKIQCYSVSKCQSYLFTICLQWLSHCHTTILSGMKEMPLLRNRLCYL